MYDISDTIAAVATPLGESGIGIIRISGPEAYEVGAKVFRPKGKQGIKEYKDRTIHFGTIVDEGGEEIDEVLVLIMKGPHSYTAENVLEIQCHGGRQSIASILQLVLRNGARLAEPGEFTQRAFLNGRIDLAQAEAVMDIIQAKSRQGLSAAVSQLEGKLSKLVRKMRTDLTDFITRLEVTVDYPEEDLEDIVVRDMIGALTEMKEKIRIMLAQSVKGRIIRDGVTVAIVGAPNAGKSSLLNYLLSEERAIVTDIPGTTRDILEEWVSIQGIPFQLVDTAGIRETIDVVETIGVTKAREYLERADIVLVVVDRSKALTKEDKCLLQSVKGKQVALILNKIDLADGIRHEELSEFSYPLILVSAKNGDGMEELEQFLVDRSLQGGMNGYDVLITNTRHIELVRQSLAALERAEETIKKGMPLDFAIIDIREAWDLLGSITGDTIHDDIIGEIFNRFCLGK